MKIERSKEWWLKKCDSEGDSPIGAGMLHKETTMNKSRDEMNAKSEAWWAAHPDLRKNWKESIASGSATAWSLPAGSAASFALSVVHWHHNVEMSRDEAEADLNRRTLRQYAIHATRAWLIEAQTEKETYPPSDPHWRSYGHSEIEVVIRNLQIALDNFERNDEARRHADPPMPPPPDRR